MSIPSHVEQSKRGNRRWMIAFILILLSGVSTLVLLANISKPLTEAEIRQEKIATWGEEVGTLERGDLVNVTINGETDVRVVELVTTGLIYLAHPGRGDMVGYSRKDVQIPSVAKRSDKEKFKIFAARLVEEELNLKKENRLY